MSLSVQRKAASKSRNAQKLNDANSTPVNYELDDPQQNTDPQWQRSKRVKRPKKSVNESLEPAFTATHPDQTQYHEFGSGG